MSRLVVLGPVRDEMPFEPTEEELRIVSEHYAYLELRAEGRLVLAGPSAEVEGIVAADPAVTGGLMTAEIRPHRISVP
jgi:uncharacterized protein YciI